MTDIIYNAVDMQHLVGLALQMGFARTNPDTNQPEMVMTGIIVSGGSFFHNSVGPIRLPTGKMVTDEDGNSFPETATDGTPWGRIRHNGDPADLAALMAQVPPSSQTGVTFYEQVTEQDGASFWSSDGGSTKAPDYVATIGLIS